MRFPDYLRGRCLFLQQQNQFFCNDLLADTLSAFQILVTFSLVDNKNAIKSRYILDYSWLMLFKPDKTCSQLSLHKFVDLQFYLLFYFCLPLETAWIVLFLQDPIIGGLFSFQDPKIAVFYPFLEPKIQGLLSVQDFWPR